ncbi:hypothetical protein K491DRAFT_677614 [Lophiostoma macrostomum CBS 122681]|uniref:Uncharacterized protein n=1 Tax=Lophiostoma macrostomum CBS 122681 TaxID=1314788 RepID=A0A6A6TAI5_9PLEO|nr:hypothetical protein K491DRAFT_677614 [Lophiostoma macrostomum CBS 122681]
MREPEPHHQYSYILSAQSTFIQNQKAIGKKKSPGGMRTPMTGPSETNLRTQPPAHRTTPRTTQLQQIHPSHNAYSLPLMANRSAYRSKRQRAQDYGYGNEYRNYNDFDDEYDFEHEAEYEGFVSRVFKFILRFITSVRRAVRQFQLNIFKYFLHYYLARVALTHLPAPEDNQALKENYGKAFLYAAPLIVLWRLPFLNRLIDKLAPRPLYPQQDPSSAPLVACLVFIGLAFAEMFKSPLRAWSLLNVVALERPSVLSVHYKVVPLRLQIPSSIVWGLLTRGLSKDIDQAWFLFMILWPLFWGVEILHRLGLLGKKRAQGKTERKQRKNVRFSEEDDEVYGDDGREYIEDGGIDVGSDVQWNSSRGLGPNAKSSSTGRERMEVRQRRSFSAKEDEGLFRRMSSLSALGPFRSLSNPFEPSGPSMDDSYAPLYNANYTLPFPTFLNWTTYLPLTQPSEHDPTPSFLLPTRSWSEALELLYLDLKADLWPSILWALHQYALFVLVFAAVRPSVCRLVPGIDVWRCQEGPADWAYWTTTLFPGRWYQNVAPVLSGLAWYVRWWTNAGWLIGVYARDISGKIVVGIQCWLAAVIFGAYEPGYYKALCGRR